MSSRFEVPDSALDVVADESALVSSKPPRSSDLAVAARNALKLAVSLTVTWTVAFFIRFPIPRILGPARYGQLTFSENFSATFFTLLDLGMTTYIFREIPVRPRHASDFWGGLIVARILGSFLLFGAMAATLAVSHHPLEVQATVFIYGLAQFVTSFNDSVAAFLNASTKVDRLAIANVLSKLLWGLGLAAALIFSRALPLLAAPLLVSELVKLSVLYPEARRALHIEHRIDIAATKAALIASLPYFITNGAINIGGRLNVAVLEFVTPDRREVGWFGAAQNLSGLTLLLSPLLTWVLMPLLARARARSENEVYEILRRTIEGLLVVVIPMTLVLSLGADLWMRLAFRSAYDPAALSLRFLSLGFILIYLAMTLSTLLVMLGHGWSVSIISLASVPARPILVSLLANPCARWLGPGGAAVGAALAEIITSVGIVGAHFIPVGTRAIDRRILATGGKSLAVAGVVMLLDRTVLAHMRWARLTIDAIVYVVLAFSVGAVKTRDVARVLRILRARRSAPAAGRVPPT
jgi:O-antigen/teichoic acid export membrane protein